MSQFASEENKEKENDKMEENLKVETESFTEWAEFVKSFWTEDWQEAYPEIDPFSGRLEDLKDAFEIEMSPTGFKYEFKIDDDCQFVTKIQHEVDKMKKYLVYDEGETETFNSQFDSLEEANDDAEMQWHYLTKDERKERHVYVAVVTGTDLDPEELLKPYNEIDWNNNYSCDLPEGGFDSEKL